MKNFIGIAIVIAAMALASPAIAQSFDPDNGSGNIVSTAASPKRLEPRTVRGHIGADAYAMSQRRKGGFAQEGWGNTNTATGGGSPGYNEMLLNW